MKLKEDVAYGIYDRPGPGIEDEPTPLEGPITAGPQMATQLSTEKPPIDDEEYTPTSISALSLAAAEIAKHVPGDQIEYFYNALHRLLDKTTDRTAIVQKEPQMQEAILQKKITKLLLEMISDEDREELERYRAGGDYSKVDVEDLEDPKAAQNQVAQKQDDKSNLDNLAAEFGFSGPSGARQYVNRILVRLGFMAEVLDDSAIEALMGLAVPEFISSMQEGDYIDQEDVNDLQSAPSLVRDLPSFKYFFVSGFILPAYREFKRVVNNKVRNSISDAGVPKSLHDTVFNQATGLAAKDQRAVNSKLQQSVRAGEISQNQVTQVASAIRKIINSPDQKPEAQEFTSLATDKWQSLSRSRRQSILKKALEQTLEEM